ncbi:hypothetical protein KAR91_35500 [Candidatus Pacearchaeota archaeon]|nr:hypothetical protein [Candidatus Pacearchaeota archaeon]
METSPEILLAAQMIAAGEGPDPGLSKEELAAAKELARQMYCPGCG